jgi:hypothetical protein
MLPFTIWTCFLHIQLRFGSNFIGSEEKPFNIACVLQFEYVWNKSEIKNQSAQFIGE